MSRIADSLVSKYKQYQALQKLIHAEKPTRSSSTSTAKYNFNATLSTTPNYGQLLTFNLAEFIQANTSPPPPSHSPLDRIRLSLLHKSPLSGSTPLPGERATGVGDSKIRELAQRIIAMKRSELDASRSSTVAPEFSKETEWTPLIPSATDHVSKLPRNHRTDYNADQYVEIYTKDRLTRLSTLAKKNDTSIVYAKSAPS
ncbi:hypothetical protein M8J77_003623 [Diaphorina citri]|nr:hypothetical protein M8J77_003623 [Diaphorina citri]